MMEFAIGPLEAFRLANDTYSPSPEFRCCLLCHRLVAPFRTLRPVDLIWDRACSAGVCAFSNFLDQRPRCRRWLDLEQ